MAASIALVVSTLAVAAPPAGAAAVWSKTTTPTPTGSVGTTLTGVACPTTTSCFAVGRTSIGVSFKTLVLHWNGSGWGVLSSPNPTGSSANLSAVACPSTKSCFAVGSYTSGSGQRTLIEHWNGAAWGFLTGANPGGSTDASLTGVACPNLKGCFAVGSYTNPGATNTLIEHWNGTQWTIQPSPNPSGSVSNLRGIACPSAQSCFAVGAAATGSGFRTLAEHWNGASWGFLATANPSTATGANLNSVACPNTKSCFAVGNYSTVSAVKTLAEHWNGSNWSTQASTNPSSSASLSAVACPNTKSCFTVGNSQVKTLIEHWNGSSWGGFASPSPPSVARLNAVDCPSARICFAVGTYTGTTFAQSLAIRYR